MFADLYNVLLLVVQVLALVWGIGLALRFIFGFGLKEDGTIKTSNRRGRAVVRMWGWMAGVVEDAFAHMKGKTHSTEVKVTDSAGEILRSQREARAKIRSAKAAKS